jgi:hypothetical protein
MRVGSTSTGALRIDRRQNPRFSEPLCRAWWIPLHPAHIRSATFADGSSHFNIHAKGTFDFDATDPTAPDFFSAPERPTNIQLQVDANGNGTQTQISGYDARGTDGSRVMVHDVAKCTVVGFTTLTVTHDNFQLHCTP